MKRVIILLAAGIALPVAAQAQTNKTAALLGPHIVCSRVALAAELMALRDDADGFLKRAKELHAQRLCA